jgi:transposase
MEKRKSRTYTEEFKKQAVQLAEDLGSAKKAAKQLGVPHANVHNWKVKLSSGQSLSRSNQKNKTKSATSSAAAGVEEENQRLRRENAELKKVNHILKAAAAIFTRDHLS